MEALAFSSSTGGPSLDWAVAGRPLPGETACGDVHRVEQEARRALVAVADGLGHGPEAREASIFALTAVFQRPYDDPDALLRRAHEALRRTRGAALTLAAIDGGRLRWLGVGNVEAFVVRAATGVREHLLLAAGVVGQGAPRARLRELPVSPGDTLVITTDGISGTPDLDPVEPPSRAAARIVEQMWNRRDDVLVLVARLQKGDGA
jgi:phosphoserine phosphatase RsbX